MKPNGRADRRKGHDKTLLNAAGNPETIQDAIYTVVSQLLPPKRSLPTDLDTLRDSLAIRDISSDTIPLSGELRREKNGFRIVYSSDLPKDRQRFTIAHEMGHALLHKLGARLPHVGRHVERLCDQIAAEILMPRDVFLHRLSSDFTIERLFELPREFEVSLTAIARRCYELQGHSVFEVVDDSITWGSGIVRKGPLYLVETGLRLGIDEAYRNEGHNVEVFFRDGGHIHRGELRCTRRSKGKILFIIRRDLINERTVTANR